MKTIGIKLADGKFYPVLQEGSSNEKILNLTTANNNQTKVMVDMYRSEGKTMDDAEYVDSLQIDNLIAHPNGEPNITFTVSLDDDQNLNAKIVDTETGAQSNSKITLVTRSSEERQVTDEYNIEESKAVAAMATGIGLLATAEAIRNKQNNLEDPISEQDFSLGDISDESSPIMEDFSLEEEVPVDENFSQGDDPSPAADDFSLDLDDTPPADDFSSMDLDLPNDDAFATDDASSLTDNTSPAADNIPVEENFSDLSIDLPTDNNSALPDLDLDLPDNIPLDEPSTPNDLFEDIEDNPKPENDLPPTENFLNEINDTPSPSENPVTEEDLNIDDFSIDDMNFPTEDSDIDFDNLDKEPQEELPPPYIDDSQYHDDYERPVSKFKIPVIICIACAAICLIILLIMLLLVPSKKKNKKNTEQQTEIVQTETTQTPELVIEEAPPAKEDEVIIIEKAETVVPVEPKPAKKSNNINYKIKWGDTLWDIADTYYKNPWRYKYLARFNGIKNPDYIISGTYIIIPAE